MRRNVISFVPTQSSNTNVSWVQYINEVSLKHCSFEPQGKHCNHE